MCWVDPRSSKRIFHSCYDVGNIESQCTLKLFQRDNVVKNYETLAVDDRAGVPPTAYNNTRNFLALKGRTAQPAAEHADEYPDGVDTEIPACPKNSGVCRNVSPVIIVDFSFSFSKHPFPDLRLHATTSPK